VFHGRQAYRVDRINGQTPSSMPLRPIFLQRYRSLPGKLALGLAASALCTILVALIGWNSFQRVVNSQQAIVERVLPDTVALHELVRGSTRLAVMAPQLARAGSAEEITRLDTAITTELAQMRNSIETLDAAGIASTLAAELQQTYAALAHASQEMHRVVSQRLDLRAERQQQSARVQARLQELGLLAGAQTDNAVAIMVSILAGLQQHADGGPAPVGNVADLYDHIIDIDLDRLERMQEMQLAIHRLVPLLEQVEGLDSETALETSRQAFTASLALLRKRQRDIADPSDHTQAGRLSTALQDAAGPTGLYALMRRELNLRRQTDTLQQEMLAQTGRLDQLAGRLLQHGSEMAIAAGNSARQAAATGMTAFAITAACLLLLTIGGLYAVRRQRTFARLRELESATLALAHGQHSAPIPHEGNDALAQLAQALSTLRDKVIERDQLATELRHERATLERQVGERTAELRASNLALAHETAEHRQARIQAEQANRAKTAFLGTISHELRTPMSGILGTLELLQDTPLATTQAQYAGQIRTSATLLLDTLEDMLLYAQLDIGRPAMHAETFALRRCIDDVFAVQGSRARNQGLALTLDIAADIRPMLHGDRRKLSQILLNLVGNAIKFTQEGAVEISVCRQPGTDCSQREHLQFQVSDSGIGIPAEQIESVFEPFVQAHAHLPERQGGTGLGLSICRRLVQAMGGQISIQSQPGHGTCVTFLLDFEAGMAIQAETAESTLPAVGAATVPLRILVVEDDAVMRMVLQHMLSRLGHQVTAAATGGEALAAFATHPVDMALIDIHLPDTQGNTLMHRLRTLPGQKNLPVALMSAHASQDGGAAWLQTGADAYLAKPFERRQLMALIEALAKQDDPGAFLAEECSLLGPAAVQAIVAAYQQQDSELHASLKQALAATDPAACARLAHRLRSAAGNLGLMQLAHHARQVENMLVEQKPPAPLPQDWPTAVHTLLVAMQQARQALHQACLQAGLTSADSR